MPRRSLGGFGRSLEGYGELGRLWEALGSSTVRILRVWEALGISTIRILLVLEALGSSITRRLRVWETLGVPWAVQILTKLSDRVGPLEKFLARLGGSLGGSGLPPQEPGH